MVRSGGGTQQQLFPHEQPAQAPLIGKHPLNSLALALHFFSYKRASEDKKDSSSNSSSIFPGIWDWYPTARTVPQMVDTMENLTLTEDPLTYTKRRTPWAIKEREQDYKIRFDMPGMTKNYVRVWVEENMLVVKAEKVQPKEHREEEIWPTKSFGSYYSSIALPENIEFEKIKAEVKDGVLYITIPKATITSKIIDINVE